jgi:large subunit ribosomal protein L14
MIQKNSYLIPCDKSGVYLTKVFHLYRGFNRKISYLGDFIKVTVKRSRPLNSLAKKMKLKALIVRTKKIVFKSDRTFVSFNFNNCILLKKRTTSYGKRMVGPILKNINRKKILFSFSKVL